jgi:glutamine phosphoribosylpyrophosphate amidotransferase
MLSAVKSEKSSYCTSCYTGVYPVEFPRDEATYLQLALKLDKGKNENTETVTK